jgi:hypothetical protein
MTQNANAMITGITGRELLAQSAGLISKLLEVQR